MDDLIKEAIKKLICKLDAGVSPDDALRITQAIVNLAEVTKSLVPELVQAGFCEGAARKDVQARNDPV